MRSDRRERAGSPYLQYCAPAPTGVYDNYSHSHSHAGRTPAAHTRSRIVKIAASLLTVPILLLATACGSEEEGGETGPTVSATTGIVAGITEQVAGDDAAVEQLIPDSASPHDFALSAKDRAALEDSTLLVSNGAQLETGIPFEDIDVPQVALADHTGELLAFGEEGGHDHGSEEEHGEEEHGEEEHGEEEHGEEEHGHSGDDPHVWMDPTRVATAVPAIADALAEADPDNAEGYRERAREYVTELEALDGEVEEQLAEVPENQRELVTSHDALGYFADRYGFEVIATPFPASGPEAEPSAAAIVEVEEAVQASGVPAVFAEETDDPQVLEQIADRTGVEIVDGLLVEAPGDAGSYVEMMRRNAELIAGALAEPPQSS
ncbi:MAG: zinc ABC transporter substrate-binding protein [Actinobacteria bacterium]|nr:zinc ABC transporter substrate-binding protein [Actinomycetota bacterium]